MNIKETLDLTEKKLSTYIIYFFQIASLALPLIAIFVTDLDTYKLDLQIIILITAIAMMFRQIKNLNINIRSMDMNKLTPYSSTTTNLTEVENKLESFRTCNLLILGNSLSTMWNSLLKHFFTRIKNEEVRTQLDVKLIKRVRGEYIKNPLKDPIVSAIINWLDTHKININLAIFVVHYPLYFTGICMNDDYLKYRFINHKTNKEILGSALKGTSEIADRTIGWYIALFEDICENNRPIYVYPNTP